MKVKILTVKEKPWSCGKVVKSINVSNLNKRGIDSKWDDLEKKYPSDKYAIGLSERKIGCSIF